MALTGEWRTRPEGDSILVVEDGRTVKVALPAEVHLLSRLLSTPGDLHDWSGGHVVTDAGEIPESWGSLVIARDEIGRIVTMDPEAFWNGVYDWFRSKGIDYDSYAGTQLPGIAGVAGSSSV